VARWPSMSRGRLIAQIDKSWPTPTPMRCEGAPGPETEPTPDDCAQRAAMMPKRRRTRAHDRAARVATERRHNREARLARKRERFSYFGPAPPETDDDPPPF
jgi:hypothetical protein